VSPKIQKIVQNRSWSEKQFGCSFRSNLKKLSREPYLQNAWHKFCSFSTNPIKNLAYIRKPCRITRGDGATQIHRPEKFTRKPTTILHEQINHNLQKLTTEETVLITIATKVAQKPMTDQAIINHSTQIHKLTPTIIKTAPNHSKFKSTQPSHLTQVQSKPNRPKLKEVGSSTVHHQTESVVNFKSNRKRTKQ